MKWFCTDNITFLLYFKHGFLDSTSNRPSWNFSSIWASCALYALLPSYTSVQKLWINVLNNARERFQSSGKIRRVEWWILTDVSKFGVSFFFIVKRFNETSWNIWSLATPWETWNIPALGDLGRLRISSLCNLFTFHPFFITCSCFKIFYSDVFG
jgi:hypothetical protein